MINFTGLFYILEGTILACTTFKLWNSYQKSKNPVTQNFAFIGFFLTLALFIFGFFCLSFPQSPRLLKISILMAWVPLFISCAFGLKAFLYLKIKEISSNLAFFIAIPLSFVMLFLQAGHTEYPKVVRGITEWNLHPTSFLLFALFVLAFTIPLTIIFLQSGLEDPKIKTRSLAMGAGFFLAGIGAILNTSDFSWLIIALGDVVLSLGFASIAIAFFFTKPPLE